MRYPHLLEILYAKPWLITASGHAAVRQLVESRLGEIALNAEAKREGIDFCGKAVELPQMTIEDGIAVIPIGGVIGQGLSKIEKGYGAVGVEDIENELDQAMADASVKGIILDFDSPGGTVGGIGELAQKVSGIQKSGTKIIAFTRGQMASAAYWIASGSTAIVVSPTAEVGSIGVYLPWVDQSKRFEALGYSVEIFKSGKYKGMGYPGTSLTKDQRVLLQDGVDQLFAMFASSVKGFRSLIQDESMQGQTFLGARAVENGFADGLARNIAEVKRMFFGG